MTHIIGRVGLVALASVGLWAQSVGSPLTFEVASIKPSSADAHNVMIQMQPGGGVRMTNVTLRILLAQAYDVRDFQISGGPGWMASDRFDITAKTDRSTGADAPPPDPRQISEAQMKTFQEQLRERLRGLLAERFRLTAHRETKDAPVYALLVAKNGSKLQEAKEGSPTSGRMMMGRAQITGDGVKLQLLAQVLSNQLGRPVLDKTELTGNYDFKLTWTPDPGQGGGPFGPPPPGVEPPPPPDPNGPSLFTAVQEQLGLRLESQKGPVDMIVVDRAEKPSEN
ncbi:MAG: TIGR03435 family protein [Acidobacteriia bacterium]|nr:TIGR03435 family protein [Terriglobia bacterium]